MAEHRGLHLEVEPRRVQLGSLAVPDAHDIVPAHEEVDLAGFYGVLRVDVPQRLENHEQPVLVALELGSLMCLEGILDRERMQGEHLPHAVELLRGRLVHADPDERLVAVRLVAEDVEVFLVVVHRHPHPVAIQRAVDDHAAQGTSLRLRAMATVILARHGRTTANASGVLAGRTKGVHLDEKGVEQACEAGERLAGLQRAGGGGGGGLGCACALWGCFWFCWGGWGHPAQKFPPKQTLAPKLSTERGL